jgi:hypothetical protein
MAIRKQTGGTTPQARGRIRTDGERKADKSAQTGAPLEAKKADGPQLPTQVGTQFEQTSKATSALRSLAIETKSPEREEETKASEAASLGARLMAGLTSEKSKKYSYAAMLGLSAVGGLAGASPASAQTQTRIVEMQQAAQTGVEVGDGFVHVEGTRAALDNVLPKIASGEITADHVIIGDSPGGVANELTAKDLRELKAAHPAAFDKIQHVSLLGTPAAGGADNAIWGEVFGTQAQQVTRDGGSPASSWLQNKQANAGPTTSPLGARMLNAGVRDTGQTTQAARNEQQPVAADVELGDVEARFDSIAERLRDNPGQVRVLAGEASELLGELQPAIDARQGELTDTQGRLNTKERSLGWMAKHFDLFAPDDVVDLRDQVDDLNDWLEEAKAYRGGARIVVRAGKEASAADTPQAWQGQLNEVASRVPTNVGPGGAREDAVADLVRFQDELGAAEGAARLEAGAAKGDVEDMSEEVAWHQKVGWIDWLIGGTSDRGDLYRKGKELRDDAGVTAQGFDQVAANGEAQVAHHVNELLKLESPEYLSMRTQYDKLKPAKESLDAVLRASGEAQDALDKAEFWIQQRNMLQWNEPTEYEYVNEPRMGYDSDGNYTQVGTQQVRRETQAHKDWEDQYDHAASTANWQANRAEREVSAVNAQLPQLQNNLQRLEGTSAKIPHIDGQISSFWGSMSSFGPWSYDSGQVDKIESQLNQLDGQLNQFKGRVDPEYSRHHSWVSQRMNARRGELRQHGNADVS